MDEEASALVGTDDVARVQESLLALEMDRLCDTFRDGPRDAVAHAAAWLVALWREDRAFFQRSAVPLIAFRVFEEAAKDQQQHQESPFVWLVRRVGDTGPSDAFKELVVRLVSVEYRAFATVLGENENSVVALSRVTTCFLSVVGRHNLGVESLNEALEQSINTLSGKKAVLQLVNQSERLTPDHKVAVFLHACHVEPAASTRELAARLLLPFAAHVSSVAGVASLLADKSQKVRRIAVSCIIDIGMDCVRDELDERSVARLIATMAATVSGATQEKRFLAFVSDYIAAASNLDEMCELSIHLDEANASSHPRMAKILSQVIGAALKPSFFEREVRSQESA